MINSNRRHTLFTQNKYRKKDNKSSTVDFDDFFKKATILPNKQKPKQLEQEEQEEKEEEIIEDNDNNMNNSDNNSEDIEIMKRDKVTPIPTTVNISKILKGVIACIDVRTEDGDDVSYKFELAIQSMGGETRKIFSDTVTHLVFKNGSNATLKKAMNKSIFIINLLWISRCQLEGKRLDEKEFLIEEPLSMVLTSKRRPKSMKPRKIKGLTINEEEEEGLDDSQTFPITMWQRRHTSDVSESKSLEEQPVHKRQRTEEDLSDIDEEEGIPKPPVLSAENIADRHNVEKAKQRMEISLPSSDEAVKNNIKASFSIGQQMDIHSDMDLPARPAPLKRKRKLNSSAASSSIPMRQEPIIDSKKTIAVATTKTSLETLTEELSLIQPEPSSFISKNDISSEPISTIVFTSLSKKARERCENIVNRLGKFKVVSEVDERTTHVIVGQERRTKSVVLGLLRGALLIKPSWLYDVEDEYDYTPEKHYELSDWLPSSIHRKSSRLLSPSTRIWVKSTLSGVELIQEFIELAGGTVVYSQKEADIIISEEPIEDSEKPIVDDLWIYESIDAWKLLPTKGYLVK